MKCTNPFHLLAITPAVSFIMFENSDFQWVTCEEMPNGCDCGHEHLIPPLDWLATSEFLTDEEGEALAKEAEALEGPENSERRLQRALEVHEMIDDRAAFDACEQRARLGMSFEDDPPPELFLNATD